MASRYLRATGNWNGPVWAATSGGAAGSAATPTASDNVYIQNNFTVTLTANASAATITHTNGTLSLGSNTLTLHGVFGGGSLLSYGSTARAINLGSGTLVLNGANNQATIIQLQGTNLTFTAGSSLIVINVAPSSVSSEFYTNNYTYNDVVINLGVAGTAVDNYIIYGSPTFRSLTIQSKNSAAHTVNIDGDITVDKFIAVGSSASNRLSITDSGNLRAMLFTDNATSYGQYVDIHLEAHDKADFNRPVSIPTYIGSNSINSNGDGTWLLQDPPKISTLVDPLTTDPASNPNWTVTGTVTKVTTGHDGGGYLVDNDDDDGTRLVSSDTYDLTGDGLTFQAYSPGNLYSWFGIDMLNGITGAEHAFLYPNVVVGATFENDAYITGMSKPNTFWYFYKIKYESGKVAQYISDDGLSFSKIREDAVDEVYIKSVRIVTGQAPRQTLIGSINPSFVSPNSGAFLQFFIP